MKTFIHIGYPKAGSTYIQEEILKNISLKGFSIISNEEIIAGDFIGKGGYLTRIEIAHKLKKYYPKATIIVITRPQKEWIISWWKHIVNSSSPYCGMTLKEIMGTRFYKNNISPLLDYEKTIGTYRNLFKKVIVLDLKDRDWVNKFCNIVNLRLPESYDPKRVSKSLLTSYLKMYLNRVYFKFNKKVSKRWFYFQKHFVGRLDIVLKYLPQPRT